MFTAIIQYLNKKYFLFDLLLYKIVRKKLNNLVEQVKI